jgi:hypothetical protein
MSAAAVGVGGAEPVMHDKFLAQTSNRRRRFFYERRKHTKRDQIADGRRTGIVPIGGGGVPRWFGTGLVGGGFGIVGGVGGIVVVAAGCIHCRADYRHRGLPERDDHHPWQ